MITSTGSTDFLIFVLPLSSFYFNPQCDLSCRQTGGLAGCFFLSFQTWCCSEHFFPQSEEFESTRPTRGLFAAYCKKSLVLSCHSDHNRKKNHTGGGVLDTLCDITEGQFVELCVIAHFVKKQTNEANLKAAFLNVAKGTRSITACKHVIVHFNPLVKMKANHI